MEIPTLGRPFNITTKTVGSSCNLRCKYCYYLEKGSYYKNKVTPMMDSRTLEVFIRDYIAAQPTTDVVFVWHGGEPLLRPIAFYENVIKLQMKYGRGHNIANSIQTNGTLLNNDWSAFFRDKGWLVGLSIDGPQEIHDKFRKDRNGKSSFDKVMAGIESLNKNGVEWNILATVNSENSEKPVETYRFLKSLGTRFLQFTPVVERYRNDGFLCTRGDSEKSVAEFSVSPEKWGDFLIGMFDDWVKKDVGEIFVQTFDATLANWVGVQSPVCTMARTCGNALAVEFNGDVYSCDHFVFPQYKLGNIHKKPLIEMVLDPRQQKFGFDKSTTLPGKCKECQYLFACNGECPRNRFLTTTNGEPNLNYLCEGYYKFFNHVRPYMDFMANELSNERPPANVMNWIKENPEQQS